MFDEMVYVFRDDNVRCRIKLESLKCCNPDFDEVKFFSTISPIINDLHSLFVIESE